MHYHVYQKARGGKNYQEIGAPTRTPLEAVQRVQEYRANRGSMYVITRSPACMCPDGEGRRLGAL